MLRHSARLAVICIFSAFLSNTVFSQSKKDIVKYDIKNVTATTTINKDGSEVSFTDFSESYDKEGNVIEEKERDSKGDFRKHITRKFNRSGKLLEETQWNEKGGVIKKYIAVYDSNNERISEQTVDGNGVITEWSKATFDANGNKITEVQLDDKGKVLRKHVYSYDRNGFRKERKTYAPDDQLIMLRKYTYKTSTDK